MTTPYTPTPNWTAANRFDIAADSQILLSNTGGHDVRWTKTSDTATPALSPTLAHLLRPGQNLALNVSAGDYIWLSARPSGTALIETF